MGLGSACPLACVGLGAGFKAFPSAPILLKIWPAVPRAQDVVGASRHDAPRARGGASCTGDYALALVDAAGCLAKGGRCHPPDKQGTEPSFREGAPMHMPLKGALVQSHACARDRRVSCVTESERPDGASPHAMLNLSRGQCRNLGLFGG